ncbi:hypothetical protein [Microvirga guangxiensis]|uniref:Uncharacterized protein n=1 Tax=Microvirga guangxiensis TaxID=549386 RepID=A0A1G5JYP0_9HYPH|nr:hypothetical protein [Microvirga guangxiensis]SCY93436.1 hypothetical protein SAMN02927923_02921 [Microvirga guangxiensis]
MHPNLAAVYRKKVEDLETLLEDAAHKDEAMELIRSLVDKIVLTPKEGGGVDALLHGDLARILALSSISAEEAKLPRAVAVAGSKRNEALRSRYHAKTPDVFTYRGFGFIWLRGPETADSCAS